MLTALFAAALIAAAPAQDTGRGVIRGTVQSDPSGLPVALAVVEAESGPRTVVGMADSAGRYALRVGAGWQVVRVRHLEHAPQEMQVLVPSGGEVVLDVALELRPIALAPVRVQRLGDPRADSIAVPSTDVSYLIGHRTLGEGGGLDGALGQEYEPGTEPGGDDGEALYVRGSAGMLQLVLLDGAPVYAPFHTGGLMETFEPGVLGSARLYLGGAPARYDGGLSYVMDLSTRGGNGDGHSGAGAVDMMSARGRAEGPLADGARYLVSARTVHGASMTQLESEPFPYRFGDALARVDLPTQVGALSITGFMNRERVRIDTAGPRDGHARWGNLASSIRWRGRLKGADAELTVAGGRFDADLPQRDSGRLLQLEWEQERLRLGLDLASDLRGVRLRYGASLDRTWFRHVATVPAEYRLLLYSRGAGSAAGGYVDASWQPAGRVVLRGGLRADYFSVGQVAKVAPRASATWLVSDGAALTLAAGRYHQYVRVPRPSLQAGAPPRNSADAVRVPTQLAVASATHLSMALDQELVAGVRLGLEGFYKRFHGLPLKDATVSHNSGMDAWVRRTAGEMTGWLGYSLSWGWNSHEGLGTSAEFLGRQTVSGGIRGPVWRRTLLGVRVAYGDGLAYTPVGVRQEVLDGASLPAYQSGNSVRLDSDAPLRGPSADFLRVDAEVSRTWTPMVAGRRTQLTPYLKVLNALESRDALFYRYFAEGENGSTLQPVSTLPVVPVVGVSWQF
jgi:hypothetical protein